jgi:hypothetical protein
MWRETQSSNERRKYFVIGLAVTALLINSRFTFEDAPAPIERNPQPIYTPPTQSQPEPVKQDNSRFTSSRRIRGEPEIREPFRVPDLILPSFPTEDEEEKEEKIRKFQEEKQRNDDLRLAAEKKAAIAKAAAERAAYLARYLNAPGSRKSAFPTFAVAVASEQNRMNGEIQNVLARRFGTNSIEISSSFFNPEFITEGVFDEVLNGSSIISKKLELPPALDGLVLAKQGVTFTRNPNLENVLTATMTLDVRIVSFSSRFQSRNWNFTARGAGFRQADARMQAEERLVKQINTDTNMAISSTYQ